MRASWQLKLSLRDSVLIASPMWWPITTNLVPPFSFSSSCNVTLAGKLQAASLGGLLGELTLQYIAVPDPRLRLTWLRQPEIKPYKTRARGLRLRSLWEILKASKVKGFICRWHRFFLRSSRWFHWYFF